MVSIRQDIPQRTAILSPCRRHLRWMRNIQHFSSCFWNAGGTPLAAANSCVTDFFATILSNGKRSRCIALQAYVRSDGNHALGLPSV